MRRGEANIDGDKDDAIYCFSATEEGEGALTYEQLLQSKYKDEWMLVIDREIKSLGTHETWKLEDLPESKNTFVCKWVFRIKREPNNGL